MKLLIQLNDGTTVRTIDRLEEYNFDDVFSPGGILELNAEIFSGIQHGKRMQAEFDEAEIEFEEEQS